MEGKQASGILAVTHPSADMTILFQKLQEQKITASLRLDRTRRAYLRWSPHFYNTEDELERAVGVVRDVI